MRKVTIRLDKFKSDSEKLMRILKELNEAKITATDENEAIRKLDEEFCRQARQAGLRIE